VSEFIFSNILKFNVSNKILNFFNAGLSLRTEKYPHIFATPINSTKLLREFLWLVSFNRFLLCRPRAPKHLQCRVLYLQGGDTRLLFHPFLYLHFHPPPIPYLKTDFTKPNRFHKKQISFPPIQFHSLPPIQFHS
jgi:hypothetical protein